MSALPAVVEKSSGRALMPVGSGDCGGQEIGSSEVEIGIPASAELLELELLLARKSENAIAATATETVSVARKRDVITATAAP